MDVYLIQVSGREIPEVHREAGGKGPRFCDDPIKHGIYINAEGGWREKGYGRKKAWNKIQAGDKVLLYCTTSVKEYERALSHILTVEEKHIVEEQNFAKLEFAQPPEELGPPIPYAEIKNLVDEGKLSENMDYCGQHGFNFTKVEDHDLEVIRESSQVGKTYVEISREKDLEEFLETNPQVIESGLDLLERKEYLPEHLIPDLLYKDQNGHLLVVELKTGTAGYDAVGQIASYVGALKEKHEKVRGMLVASDFDEKAVYGAREMEIELKTYQMQFDLENY